MKGGLYRYAAVARGGYDGDSSRADIALGFNQAMLDQRLRWYGIDTAEIKGKTEIEKKLAQAALAMREEILPEGTEFVLESHRDEDGKYGRILARIYVEQPNGGWFCVNDHLVKVKLAQPYFGEGQRVAWPEWYETYAETLDPLLERYT